MTHTLIRTTLVALAVMILACPSDALAGRHEGFQPAGPEPDVPPFWVHHSYVRDGTGAVVALDNVYADDIGAAVLDRYGSVDLVMTQCFGGGFGPDIDAQGLSYTFASASAWSECSWSWDVAAPRQVDNFSRAWDNATSTYPADGFYNDWGMATFGTLPGVVPAVVKDPFAAPGVPGAIEHPQYWSADAVAGGPNDLRTLSDGLWPFDGNQHAILVAWDEPDDRHAINIARLYQTLVNVHGVDPENIAVLYDSPAPLALGPWGAVLPNPGGLPAVPTSAGNTRADWLNALGGAFFDDEVTSDTKLFVYNTGHGGHLYRTPLGDFHPPGQEEGVLYTIQTLDRFHTGEGHTESDYSVVTNPDGLDLLQLTFRDEMPDEATLSVNGVDFGLLSQFLVDATDELPLAPIVDGETVSYQVWVEHTLLDAGGDYTAVDFCELGDYAAPDVLVAATFRGGDQEYMALVVPEPTVIALLLVAFFAHRRRQR